MSNEEAFIIEITQKDTEWVKERRTLFICKEIIKRTKEFLRWEEILSSYPDWFYEAGYSSVLKPLKEQIQEREKELEIYVNPKNIDYEKRITEEDIARANETDCASFVSIKRKMGDKNWALCVFHQDRNPSLCCYGKGKGFYCFSCNEGGDAIKLVRKIRNCSFSEAVNYINHSL